MFDEPLLHEKLAELARKAEQKMPGAIAGFARACLSREPYPAETLAFSKDCLESKHQSNFRSVSMAHPRHAERREVNEARNETAQKVAEETSRAARTAREAGMGAALAGGEMLQRNAETAHRAWESGSKMASQLIEQSMQQFARAFGMTGAGGQQATQQLSRNMEALVQSGSIIAGGMQSISREMFEVAHNRLEQNLRRADSLISCRTPQELVTAHSEFVRENLEDFVQSTRRIAEISMQMADETARRVTQLR
jgi:phasin family protein